MRTLIKNILPREFYSRDKPFSEDNEIKIPGHVGSLDLLNLFFDKLDCDYNNYIDLKDFYGEQ